MTNQTDIEARAEAIRRNWETDPRWDGIVRDYSAEDVVRLQGSLVEQHSLADAMARKLWSLLTTEDYVNALARELAQHRRGQSVAANGGDAVAMGVDVRGADAVL